MHSTGESPNAENVSTLSQILQAGAPEKYYLSPKACLGILRRAVENGIPPEDIFVERNGEKIMYSDLVKEVEVPDE